MNNTIALLNPLIPQNTGTIARLCVVTNTTLHLLGTLGFELSDKYLKRAGMDYWQHLNYIHNTDIERYMQTINFENTFLFSTKASKSYTDITFPHDSILMFGNESVGAPPFVEALFETHNRSLRLPMLAQHRSINVAVSTGIALYEVLRQQGFEGLV